MAGSQVNPSAGPAATPPRRPGAALVDTTNSPHARLRPVPITAVTLSDTFWAPRRRVNREVTLPTQYQQLEETGRLANFRRAAGKQAGPFHGRFFNDSDVYKWLEGLAWTLATDPDPTLSDLADRVIADIAAAQQPDGYLNTYFMFDKAAERWTNFDLHEMYCAGHLFQAAVAHYRATGKTSLLDIATRCADQICATFGPEDQGKRLGADGHPEVELALVELYRATGDRTYLEQAQFFVDVRGYGLLGNAYGQFGSIYHQDHRPFRDLSRLEGHAVRALYLNAGATDLVAESGETAVRAALDRMWDNMTTAQCYVSGGVGSRYEGEAFGRDYELPNERAYTETCAAIGSLMWAWRMLALTGDAQYTDMLETALYNGILSGISLQGDTYFYQNPLADDGTHRRQPWFGTACCPPNLVRLLAALPGHCYSVSDAGVWVHLYAEGTARISLADGRQVALAQQTRYPWDGDITLEVDGAGDFSVRLRIPAWCETGAAIMVNGAPWPATRTPGGYADIQRSWAPGDHVQLQLPMPARRVVCHPYVAENAGRLALMRGPLLYCVEAVDHPGVDVRELVLPATADLTPVARPDLLGGVVVLQGMAEHAPLPEAWRVRLYRTAGAPRDDLPRQGVPLTAVPYYAWANRAAGRMQVWLRAR